MSRLFSFILLFLCWAGSLQGESLRLRLLAGNLTSGNLQSYDLGHGSRILQGLKPDVALIQETRFGNQSSSEVEGWVRAVFGPSFFLYREDRELPNAVLSRFEMVESGSWDDPEQVNRDFAWAKIKIRDGQYLYAVSVHLSAKKAEMRLASARALVRAVQKVKTEKDWLVIGGDFNTQDRNEAALRELAKVVVIEAPFPADEDGNENTNALRKKPYDAVYVDPVLQKMGVPVTLGGGPGGLVFDSRVFRDLSRVEPVQKEDSAAPQMQHMAVVRDFLIP